MAEEKKEFKKREPALNVKIADITKGMQRIAVIGTIIRKDDSVFSVLIDDGSGEINAILNSEEMYNELSTGQTIRVIGKVWGEEKDVEIQVEIVSDFSGIDADLYKKAFLE